MKTAEDKDREWMRRRFPDARARIMADKATDSLPENAPMTEYIDRWIAAYKATERGKRR